MVQDFASALFLKVKSNICQFISQGYLKFVRKGMNTLNLIQFYYINIAQLSGVSVERGDAEILGYKDSQAKILHEL